MDTDGQELLLERETHEIIGCAMEVINELGHGLLEKPYENALVVEFGLRGIPFMQQPQFDVIDGSNKYLTSLCRGAACCALLAGQVGARHASPLQKNVKHFMLPLVFTRA